MKPNIILIPAPTHAAKIQSLLRIAQDHFIKKERLCILAPDDVAANYIDNLLWRTPEESFLPHGIQGFTPHMHIIISIKNFTTDSLHALFNLQSTPLLETECVKSIYEYEDYTSPDKKHLSEEKFRTYRQAGFAISSWGRE